MDLIIKFGCGSDNGGVTNHWTQIFLVFTRSEVTFVMSLQTKGLHGTSKYLPAIKFISPAFTVAA